MAGNGTMCRGCGCECEKGDSGDICGGCRPAYELACAEFRKSAVATTDGRKRPICQITLSVEARCRLDEMATRCGETRSGMIEKLVRETEMPRPRTAGKLER